MRRSFVLAIVALCAVCMVGCTSLPVNVLDTTTVPAGETATLQTPADAATPGAIMRVEVNLSDIDWSNLQLPIGTQQAMAEANAIYLVTGMALVTNAPPTDPGTTPPGTNDWSHLPPPLRPTGR